MAQQSQKRVFKSQYHIDGEREFIEYLNDLFAQKIKENNQTHKLFYLPTGKGILLAGLPYDMIDGQSENSTFNVNVLNSGNPLHMVNYTSEIRQKAFDILDKFFKSRNDKLQCIGRANDDYNNLIRNIDYRRLNNSLTFIYLIMLQASSSLEDVDVNWHMIVFNGFGANNMLFGTWCDSERKKLIESKPDLIYELVLLRWFKDNGIPSEIKDPLTGFRVRIGFMAIRNVPQFSSGAVNLAESRKDDKIGQRMLQMRNDRVSRNQGPKLQRMRRSVSTSNVSIFEQNQNISVDENSTIEMEM